MAMWRGLGHCLFACLVVSTVAAAALPAEPGARHKAEVNFPGDGIKEVRSKTGVTVYYTDPGENEDGIDERPILLQYPSGHSEQIDTFTRNADVSWSPRGAYLAVTNWIGSNVADCSIVTPSPSGARKQSLTSLIGDKLPAVSRDIRAGDHVYVSCGRWTSPARVEVEVNGYGCNKAPCTPRSFDHFLIYDLRAGHFTPSSRRASRKRGV
jgi:hypothetical protein